MTVTFAGKQAIVTGAGSGIGAALCRAWPPQAPTWSAPTSTSGRRPHRRTPGRPIGTTRRHRRRRRAGVRRRRRAPDRPTRPDVQQRGHHVGRRHRTADPGPVERDHRRQHPRRRARRRRGLPADGPPRPRPHRQHRVDGRARRGRPDHQLRDDQACGGWPFARPALRGRRPRRRRARDLPDRRRDADPRQGRDRRIRRPRLLPHGSAQRDVLLRRTAWRTTRCGPSNATRRCWSRRGKRARRGGSAVWPRDCCNACPSDSSPSNAHSKPPTPQAARNRQPLEQPGAMPQPGSTGSAPAIISGRTSAHARSSSAADPES